MQLINAPPVPKTVAQVAMTSVYSNTIFRPLDSPLSTGAHGVHTCRWIHAGSGSGHPNAHVLPFPPLMPNNSRRPPPPRAGPGKTTPSKVCPVSTCWTCLLAEQDAGWSRSQRDAHSDNYTRQRMNGFCKFDAPAECAGGAQPRRGAARRPGMPPIGRRPLAVLA